MMLVRTLTYLHILNINEEDHTMMIKKAIRSSYHLFANLAYRDPVWKPTGYYSNYVPVVTSRHTFKMIFLEIHTYIHIQMYMARFTKFCY